MKTVARALGVSRSNMIDRLNGNTRSRGRYCKIWFVSVIAVNQPRLFGSGWFTRLSNLKEDPANLLKMGCHGGAGCFR